jgi:hypothetical protein
MKQHLKFVHLHRLCVKISCFRIYVNTKQCRCQAIMPQQSMKYSITRPKLMPHFISDMLFQQLYSACLKKRSLSLLALPCNDMGYNYESRNTNGHNKRKKQCAQPSFALTPQKSNHRLDHLGSVSRQLRALGRQMPCPFGHSIVGS